MSLKMGDVFTWERTFEEKEPLQFAELSGDKGRHHVERNEAEQFMVHGLFTASVGTKIGGDLHYIAREMNVEFVRPVFTGDTITCVVEVTHVEQKEGYKQVDLASVYRNQHGKEVLVGSTKGIIKDK